MDGRKSKYRRRKQIKALDKLVPEDENQFL
jgi:hypothetical protein